MILEDEEAAAALFSLPFTALVRRKRREERAKRPRFSAPPPFSSPRMLLGPRPLPSGPGSTLTASLRLCLYTISPLFLYTPALRRNCDAPSLYLLVFSPLFPHPRPAPDEMERYIVLFCVVERVLVLLRLSVRVIDFRRRRGEMIKEKPLLLRSGK